MAAGLRAMAAAPLLLLLLLAVVVGSAAARSPQEVYRRQPGELSFELDELQTLDEEPAPHGDGSLGVTARRRRPLTARSYQHAAKAQGDFGMDLFKVIRGGGLRRAVGGLRTWNSEGFSHQARGLCGNQQA